jgi:phosphatidylglycerophosphatase A
MQTEPSLGPADELSDGPLHGGPPGSPEPRPVRPRRATARFMLTHPLHLISLGFGSGLSPIMPGTVGTLFGWASFAVLNAI